jgi:hypothetical protein
MDESTMMELNGGIIYFFRLGFSHGNKPSSYWTIPEQTMESPSYEGGFSSYDEPGR